jgi:hypothetical protein
MATIKHPFGNDLNSDFYGGLDSLGTMTAKQAKAVYTIDSMFSFIRSATAAVTKKVSLTIDDKLPAGAILVIYHDRPGAPTAPLNLGTGFATAAKKGLRRIGMSTKADGTGNYQVTFIYNGTKFIPISYVNLAGTSKLAK